MRLKNTFNKFIKNNSNEIKGIEIYENFFVKYYIIYSPSFDDYKKDYKPIKRIIKSTAMKLTLLLTSIRFGISGIFNNPWVLYVMSDCHYLVGNQRLFSMMLFGAALCMSIIANVILVREYNYLLDVLVFLRDINNYRNHYQLNEKYSKKFGLYSNLMAKYFLYQPFYSLTIFTSIVLTAPTVFAYMDPKMDFNLCSIIVWNIITIVFCINFFAITAGGFGVWVLTSLYLKYQFKEVREQIDESLRYRNVPLIMDAIFKHTIVSKNTMKLNDLFKYIIFSLHYISTPSSYILMFMIHSKDSNQWVRYWAAFTFVLIVIIIFSINLFCALFSRQAHSSIKHLYSFITKTKPALHNRIRIMNFIERLSGPDIGFYCLNLFPINNLEFFQYVVNCIAYYILFLTFI